MKIFTTLTLLVLFITVCIAQPRKKEQKNLQFGLKAGGIYTQINDVSKTLVSEPYYSNYTFKNNGIYGFTGGMYINYRFEESIAGVYSEFSYSRLGTLLQYSDINNLNYDLSLKYEFINWELIFKAYVYKGLQFGIGPQIGFNITPGGLYYTSNGEITYGPDIRIQQQMRDVLKGRANFSLRMGIGYELLNGLSFEVRYYYGFSDVLETEVNNFHFIENKNAARTLSFTVGYALPYNL